MISTRTGLQIEIKELSLSWFGAQKAQGVHIQKKQEQLDLTAQEVKTDAPLWKIVFTHQFGQMQITAPDLQISKPFQPTAYVNRKSFRAAAVSPELGMVKLELPAKGKVIVKEGKVGFRSPGLEPITFDQLTLSLDMMSNEELALALSCTTSQQGQIAIKASASQLKAPFPNLAVQSTINQLPVQGIDQLFSLAYPEASGLLYSFLGPTINIGCNLSASSGNFDLRLNAISPHITAYVSTQSLNGTLSLKSPAELNFTLTPSFLQKLSKLQPSLCHLALTSPVVLQTTIDQFSCPIPSHMSDLLNSTFQAHLTAPPQIPLTLDGRPLLINHLTLNANSQQQLALELAAGLQADSQEGFVTVQGTLLKDLKGGTIALNAKEFPVDLMGILANAPDSLSGLLGPAADIQATYDFQGKGHLTWQSDFLKIPSLDLSLGKSVTLTSPCAFALILNPLYSPLSLAQALPIQGTVQKLNIPLQDIKNSQLTAVIGTGAIVIKEPLPLTIAKAQASIDMKTLDQIELRLDSDTVKAFIAGSYQPDKGVFTLSKPFTGQFALDQASLKELAKPAIVQLSIDSFAVPLLDLDLSKLKIKGQLSSAEILLGVQGKRIALQNTTLPFQWDGLGKSATMQVSSQVFNPSGSNGSIQGQVSLSQFSGLDFSASAIQGSLDLQNLSAGLLDAFSGQCLSPITGPSFNSKLKVQSTPDKQSINIKWLSPNLNVDTGFTMDSSLQLQGGSNQMVWTLTSEGYKALDQLLNRPTAELIPFEMKEPSVFTIMLSKLALPIAYPSKTGSLVDRIPQIDFDVAKLQLNLTGKNPKLAFLDKSSGDTIQLSNLNFSMTRTDQNPLAFSLDSAIATKTSKNGLLSANGKLEQTLNAQGAFDLSQLTGSLRLKADQLPSRALDLIARAYGRTDFPFTCVFGNMINATLNLDLDKFSGPLALNIFTPLTRADVSGTITNGALTLKDAVHVQMKITPEMSRLVLKEVNPLNLSYLYSQEPVTLEIPAAGFSFPLHPFDLTRIAIPSARIELGKITCRNEGNVHIALGLLKTKQFEQSNDLMLWFAPIDLSVGKGLANIDRTEILLADTYDICLWGNVDLAKDYIDMYLGLTAQTLSKAFNIKNLPENYVLRIPMRGKADNVQIDTGKATAKIALLLAAQQAGTAGALKGPAGAIVGGLLNKAVTLPDSDAKIPPAKHPFPWEIGGKTKSKTSDSTVKKRQFKAHDKPLKQILKIVK